MGLTGGLLAPIKSQLQKVTYCFLSFFAKKFGRFIYFAIGSYDPIVLEDPKDDIYIITAIEGNAECIVSGDNHLLNLNSYEGIPILKPSNFLKWTDHLSQVSAYEFHEERASLL